MAWLRRCWRPRGPRDDERRALEDWTRRRFQLAASDPMIAIIGAVARLTDAGLTVDDATDTVLHILHEDIRRRARYALTVPAWAPSHEERPYHRSTRSKVSVSPDLPPVALPPYTPPPRGQGFATPAPR